MIEALDLIARDSVIKRNSIKFLKKIDVFNDNNFSYLIKFKSLKHKFHVITVI